jgi:hypothetical protein
MVAVTTLAAAWIIHSAYADVEIPEISLTELVLARAAERGDKPALIDSASGRTLSSR